MLSCVSLVFYDILINRSVASSIKPFKDIRQGDPLSLYLFILCVEVFTYLMLRKESNKKLNAINLSHDISAISDLLYVDDIVISCRVNEKNMVALRKVLHTFRNSFGQEASEKKLQILLSLKVYGAC